MRIAAINQDGENRSGAATLAAAMAEAFRPGSTIESILDVMETHSDFVIRRAVLLARSLAEEVGTAAGFTELFYERMLDRTWPAPMGTEPGQWSLERPWSASSIEIVPAVAGLIAVGGSDVNESLIDAASFGRDCDTIASIVGNILGASHGASSIRASWISECENVNRDLLSRLAPFVEPTFDAMAGDPRRIAGILSTRGRPWRGPDGPTPR
ncbi:hypothetical protein FHX48_000625 [Microbacterium halimionae]|uniref:ADP-ribosylglycohydrolase n=1 Tax=Microbacterium halimionae TaxID=1526413 RepID=A0A7W3JMK3_9MICO|nr:ADP-ribosylglycohydrolase family protein [Microbacterium halimionae]MBA8815573.1 hypothetical protein [Microbacterium halimionae]NII95619.1 hypothetical protein [Microbacterium halimionae]